MKTLLKRTIWLLLALLALTALSVWLTFSLSLPALDGEVNSSSVSAPASLSRDSLGQAVITAENRADALFALGYAHGQDRFFQMDLQRKAAAGELASWFGSAAIPLDKVARFHQFRQRANRLYDTLDKQQQALLQHYTAGVNQALASLTVVPPEYVLTMTKPQPWTEADSILVVYSMYLDLQRTQIELDLTRTGVIKQFDIDMLSFLFSQGPYQAALDGSRIDSDSTTIPSPVPAFRRKHKSEPDEDVLPPADIGSNNWAVTGEHTKTGAAMLANDMHLSLRTPTIWYRTQLNYSRDGKAVTLTGVSLPGIPGVVVGTNNAIAWGFTNANLDNVDWIALPDDANVWQVSSPIQLPDGGMEPFAITMSDYGPVKTLEGKQYALHWVAYEPYAFNMKVTDFDLATNVDDAIGVARTIRLPVQNLMITDSLGNAAWTPGGAVVKRTVATHVAVAPEQVEPSWQQADNQMPVVKNPANGRLWTANARVIGTRDLSQYGDGGYALGARAQQIRDRLLEQDIFDEQDFYRIQLDNEARFLKPWHTLLVDTLSQHAYQFSEQLQWLQNWQACACADSVGYTLVRRYRTQVIKSLFTPVFRELRSNGYRPETLLRQIEQASWTLLQQQPDAWLPAGSKSWPEFLLNSYRKTERNLFKKYNTANFEDLRWGKVNQLVVQHPIAEQIPELADILNTGAIAGFGDSYMPAVQGNNFGASQRLFVQPGHLQHAILTLPGGQSGHFLSDYYRAGFSDYANNKTTPLLPGEIQHTLTFMPAKNN